MAIGIALQTGMPLGLAAKFMNANGWKAGQNSISALEKGKALEKARQQDECYFDMQFFQ